MPGGIALCVVPICTDRAMFCCLFGVSGLAESCSGSQNHCVGLLAEEGLGREKLEVMTEYRLRCRQRQRCISPFPIQNLIPLTSKSSLLRLLHGVKLHLLPMSEQVRSLWETDSYRTFFPQGQLLCAAGWSARGLSSSLDCRFEAYSVHLPLHHGIIHTRQ